MTDSDRFRRTYDILKQEKKKQLALCRLQSQPNVAPNSAALQKFSKHSRAHLSRVRQIGSTFDAKFETIGKISKATEAESRNLGNNGDEAEAPGDKNLIGGEDQNNQLEVLESVENDQNDQILLVESKCYSRFQMRIVLDRQSGLAGGVPDPGEGHKLTFALVDMSFTGYLGESSMSDIPQGFTAQPSISDLPSPF
ncbi:hypothetical protein BJ742DRAFT_740303 [Cladochytrium replicatum]|nr:hypothetical protein BJ742DRAFT_740303 [Cladochytrium replicatum]